MKGGALTDSEVLCDLLPVIADDATSLEHRADGPGFRPISDGLRRDAETLCQLMHGQVPTLWVRCGELVVCVHTKNLENRDSDKGIKVGQGLPCAGRNHRLWLRTK